MKKLLAAFALCLASTTAPAQLFRAYLSLAGNDANPCTLPQPCRLLPAALAAAADGGEVWLLDSANYNATGVVITKSVSILAVPGVIGSLVANGGDAVTIASPNVDVTLQNLSIAPLAPGNLTHNGVKMTDGARLTLRQCRIQGFSSGRGVWVTTSQAPQVTVLDSFFRNNSAGMILDGAFARVVGSHFEHGGVGIELETTAPNKTSLAMVSRSTFSRTTFGLTSVPRANSSATRLYVSDSVLDANNSAGILASQSYSGSVAEATVTNSFVHSAQYGLRAIGAGAKIFATGNTITNTLTAMLQESGALFESAGNNFARNNVAPTGGTVTPVATY